MKYILSIDQGTTSSRSILFDHEGNICSVAQKEFTQIFPKPGWVEHNPQEIWSSQASTIAQVITNVGAESKDIVAIGITNQRETTIVWDAEANGVGYVAFSPLAQGLLTNKYINGIPDGSRMARREHLTSDALTPEVLEKIKALNAIAEERGETLANMALAWVLRIQGVTSVIIGTSSVKQMQDNLKVLNSQPFSEEQIARINAIIN